MMEMWSIKKETGHGQHRRSTQNSVAYMFRTKKLGVANTRNDKMKNRVRIIISVFKLLSGLVRSYSWLTSNYEDNIKLC